MLLVAQIIEIIGHAKKNQKIRLQIYYKVNDHFNF